MALYENKGREFYPSHEIFSTDTNRGFGLGCTYLTTTSGSFTLLSSSSSTTDWPSGLEFYDVHQLSVVNNSATSTFISISIGEALATSNYIIYNQTLNPWGVLNPVTTENRYFINAGRDIYVQQTGSVSVSYCAGFNYFRNDA